MQRDNTAQVALIPSHKIPYNYVINSIHILMDLYLTILIDGHFVQYREQSKHRVTLHFVGARAKLREHNQPQGLEVLG